VKIPAFLNKHARQAQAAEKALREAGCFEVRVLDGEELTNAIRSAVASGAKRIAVAGGDGTISSAAALLVGTHVELAVVPAGTYNHFAKDIGLRAELGSSCEVAASQRVVEVDVGTVNGRVFLNTSSVGMYANFVRRRDRHEPTFGRLALFRSAIETLARFQPFKVSFETDAGRKTYLTPQVFIGLGERELRFPKMGNRIEGGRPGLHVMIVRAQSRSRFIAIAVMGLVRGLRAISRTPHFDAFLLRSCSIEQRHSSVALDGEIVRLDSPLEYELRTAALKVVVPASTI
jgi:diacylglycerol kinase family enzyme